MYQNECYRRPLTPKQYPGTGRPMQTLRRCACGRMTFLDLPCGNCGATPKTAVLEEKGGGEYLFQAAVLGGILLPGAAVTIAAAALVHPAAAVLIALAAVAAAAAAEVKLFRTDAADRQFYWRSHSEWKPLFRRVEAALPRLEGKRLEPIIDAWYLDMDRVERLALREDWAQAMYGARQLSQVFRNARLARLQYQALLHLPGDGREGYDLNEVCANLRSGDIPDEDVLSVLRMIGDAVHQGGCTEQDNLKRLFAPLLQRHLRRIGQYASAEELAEPMGRDFFLYCGGEYFHVLGGEHGEPPKDAEGRHTFYERLVTEMVRDRQKYLEDGTWYPILRILRTMQSEDAANALRTLEFCFFHREEHKARNNFYEQHQPAQGVDEDVNLLHPEQRKFFTEVLGYWVVDENGNAYTSSAPFLAELAKESRRVQYETDAARQRPAFPITEVQEQAAGQKDGGGLS